MPFWPHDGLQFHYREAGAGLPFVFQHGLGGDVGQPFGLFQPPDGVRLLAFDCRGHGETRPLGPEERIGIGPFADDLLAFLDHAQVSRAVIGGTSMGAAVALNFTLRHPERVLALVLSRPAWLAGPMQRNAAVFGRVAQLIREHGPAEGKARFRESEEYREALRQSSDSASSLLAQFDHPRAAETAIKLERIPNDTPCGSLEELAAIRVPTLIMANRQDPIHPFEYGQTLKEKISTAQFRELTPKSVDLDRHTADVQKNLEEFLRPIAASVSS